MPGAQAVVAAALARGVPVVSARQMLTWLDGRNGSSFADLGWTGNTLHFSIDVASGANGLQAMLPTQGATGRSRRSPAAATRSRTRRRPIKGIEYAVFDATAGAYAATYDVDATGPVISAVAAVPGAAGTATITWTTDEPATSRVDYGTSAGRLELDGDRRDADHVALGPAHGARSRHDLSLPRDLGRRRRPTRRRRRSRPRPRPRFTTPTAVADRHDRRATSPPVRPAPRPTSPTPPAARSSCARPWGRVPGDESAQRLGGGSVDRAATPSSRSGNLTVDGASPGRPTLYDPGRVLEFRGDLQWRDVPERRVRRRLQQRRALGSLRDRRDVRASSTHASRTMGGRKSRGSAPAYSAPSTPSGSSGRPRGPVPGRRDARAHVGEADRRSDAADRRPTTTPAAGRSSSTGCG